MAGTGDAVYMPAKFTLKGRYPGHELEAQAVVDHGKPAGGKRQSSAIDPCNGLARLCGHMRQPRFLRQAPTHAVELSVAQSPDQIAADNNLVSIAADQTPFRQHVGPPIKRGADLNRMIPALSAYIGQVGLGSTDRYLSLTPERFRTQLDKLSPRRGKKHWRDNSALMRFLAEL